MTKLCYEYLSVWCIWLYVIIMSRTCFRMNLHFTVAFARYLEFKLQQQDSNLQPLSS